MEISANGQMGGWGSPSLSAMRERQDSFAGVLSRRSEEGMSKEAKARRAAEEFVAVAFVQPVLKELRESNKAPAPFGPGPAEKQFRTFMDAAQAQQMVKASNFPLVQRVATDLAKAGRTDRPAQERSIADVVRGSGVKI